MFQALFASVTFLLAASAVRAIGSPKGFATGTTGGAGGPTVTPTSQAQLITYLNDNVARTVVLTQMFDFTNYYGTTTGPICKPFACTNGYTPQLYINTSGFCSTTAPTGTATWYNSGASKSLVVGSNKTLLGKGASAGIKGIGLTIHGVTNVIVQNIQITDLNPLYVWGGDAIGIDGASKIWIDHNYITRVGRQFIVTGFNPVTQLTISNNWFDGRTPYSATCNNEHYWAFLFTGSADTITMMQNHIYMTSGRGPHVGGTAGYTQQLHLVNNYYESLGGHAIDAEAGAIVLAEGNYFTSVIQPDTGSSAGGTEYFVQTVADAGTCTSYLSRVCEWNRLDTSGTVASRLTTSVLSALGSASVVKSLTPMPVASVPAYVQANRGVGIIN